MRYSIVTFATLVLASISLVNDDGGALSAQANDFWIGTGTGNYHTNSNWADGSAAGSLDEAFFDANGSYQVRWNNFLGSTFSRSLTVRNGDVRFFNLSTPQIQHRVGNNLVVESGSLEISSHQMTIVDDIQVSEVLEINSGSQINVLQGMASSHVTGDDSVVTITGDGTVVDVGNSFVVGQRGISAVTLDDEALLDLGFNLVIGTALPGSNGSSFVIDGGASVEADNIISVSGAGGNSLDIFDGSATASRVTISSNNFVTLSGETAELTSDSLNMGFGVQAAVLNVFEGGTMTNNSSVAGDVVLGVNFDSLAQATVNGDASEWNMQSSPDLGFAGRGTITVENRGRVNCGAGETRLGVAPSGVGNILVSGAGSRFTCDQLTVGANDSATVASGVRILDGGRMVTGDAMIGVGFVSIEGGVLESGNVVSDGTLFSTQDGMGTFESLQINESTFFGALDESTMNSLSDTTVLGLMAVRGESTINTLDQIFVGATGRVEMTGATPRIESAELFNEGLIDITASNAAIQGSVINRGCIVKSGGGGLSVFGSIEGNNDAEIEIEAGNSLAVHGRFVNSNGALGEGSVFLLNEFDPIGEEVGGVGGALFSGNLQLRPTSTTNIEIASEQVFDFFDVDGLLDIQGGALKVEFVNNFVPIVGSTFALSYVDGELTGEFAGMPDGAVVASAGGVNLVINYDYVENCIHLDAVEALNAIQPNAFTTFRGIANGGGLTEILDSDDQRANFLPGFTLNPNEPPVWLIFEGTSPNLDPSSFSVSIESQANTPGISLTVEAFNFVGQTYEQIGGADVEFNSDSVFSVPLLNTDDYIDTDGGILTRVGYRQTGFVLLFPWEVKVDSVNWQVN